HQTASGGELARKKERGHRLVCCQAHELFAPTDKNGSEVTRSASVRRSAAIANAVSISRSLLALRTMSCKPSALTAPRPAVTRTSAAESSGSPALQSWWPWEPVRAATLCALPPDRG